MSNQWCVSIISKFYNFNSVLVYFYEKYKLKKKKKTPKSVKKKTRIARFFEWVYILRQPSIFFLLHIPQNSYHKFYKKNEQIGIYHKWGITIPSKICCTFVLSLENWYESKWTKGTKKWRVLIYKTYSQCLSPNVWYNINK